MPQKKSKILVKKKCHRKIKPDWKKKMFTLNSTK